MPTWQQRKINMEYEKKRYAQAVKTYEALRGKGSWTVEQQARWAQMSEKEKKELEETLKKASTTTTTKPQ